MKRVENNKINLRRGRWRKSKLKYQEDDDDDCFLQTKLSDKRTKDFRNLVK